MPWSAMCWQAGRELLRPSALRRKAPARDPAAAPAQAGIHRGRPRRAPVQQVVLTGADVDLTKLPVHLQHGKDGGPFISAAMDFARDARPAGPMWAAPVDAARPRHHRDRSGGAERSRAIYLAALKRGERLPLSVVVGGHPIDYFGATDALPVDELDLLASLRAAPMPDGQERHQRHPRPADAEWVLEGYLGEEGYHEPEGTLRRVPGLLRRGQDQSGVPRHRHHAPARRAVPDPDHRRRHHEPHRYRAACRLRTEVLIWRALETAIREPVAVYAPAATGGTMNVRIAMRQRVPGEARNAIMAAFGSLGQRQERVRGRSRHRHLLRRADGMGAGHALPAAPRSRGGERSAPSARSLARRGTTGAKAGYDLTCRSAARRSSSRKFGAAALRRGALSNRSRRRCGTAQILREPDGGARQRRRPRDRARAGRAGRAPRDRRRAGFKRDPAEGRN